MPYVPPPYEVLRVSTSTLIREFNRAAKRYQPPPYAQLYEQICGMADSYKQRVAEKSVSLLEWLIGKKPEPDSMRIEIIDRIYYLARHLPTSVAEGSAEQIQQHNILLGALFYPYLLIDASYNEPYTARFFSYVGLINVDKTALYSTIKDMLNISDENKLDELSIATRCSAYLDYLRERGVRGENLASYVPQGNDNFFQQLQARIALAQSESKPVAKQIEYLKLIQSFEAILNNTDTEVSAGLIPYCDSLTKALKTQQTLSRAEMVASLSKIKMSLLASDVINYLLQDGEILTRERAPAFLEDMKGRLAIYSQFTLLGMYVVMLVKSGSQFPLVTETLNTAIGITPAEVMDQDTCVLTLSSLHHYLQKLFLTPHNLDCSLWGTSQGLLKAVEDELTFQNKPVLALT